MDRDGPQIRIPLHGGCGRQLVSRMIRARRQRPGRAAANPGSHGGVASGPTASLIAIVAASALALTSYAVVSRCRKGAPGGAPTVAVPITAYLGFARNPSISPDGSKVAFSWGLVGSGSNPDIYVKSVRSGEPQRLTTNPARDDAPAWSPDGRSIAFMRSISGGTTEDLMVIPATGGDERRLTTMSVPDALKRSVRGLAWTPDGRWLAVGGQPSENDSPGIWLIAVDSQERRSLTNAPSDARDELPAFSPDGNRLAFIRRSPLQPARRRCTSFRSRQI